MRWDPRWPSAIALVVANLVPVYGILASDWSAKLLLVIYLAEIIVIMLFSLLRILFHYPGSLAFWLVKLLGLPLLLGFLWPLAIPPLILLATFWDLVGTDAMRHALVSIVLAPSGREDLLPLDEAVQVFGPAVAISIAALVASHLLSFLWNFLVRGECNRIGFVALFLQPLLRVGLVVTVMIGTMYMSSAVDLVGGEWQPLRVNLDVAEWTLFPLIGVKIALDLFAHLMEHRTPPQPALPEPKEVQSENGPGPNISRTPSPPVGSSDV